MQAEGTPPWWRRWLWLNLMLAAAVAVLYLLSLSLEEMREWWDADGYFARRRERKDAGFLGVTALLELFLLVTIYRIGRGWATHAAGTMALVMAGAFGIVHVIDDLGLYADGQDNSVGGAEAGLIAYILFSHVAFFIAGVAAALGARSRTVPP